MHVVVAGWLDDGQPSGARRRLRELLRAIAPQLESGESITVVHGTAAEAERFDGPVQWRHAALPAGPTLARARAERAQLPRLLDELQASVVELAALPVPAALPCPVSLTVHDLRDVDGFRRRPIPGALIRAAMRRSFRRVASITVPSEFTASRLRARFTKLPPIQVIPGGVRIAAREPAAEPPFVLHVGHLERRKNLGILIDALAELPPPLELRLVGADHGERAALEARARARGVAGRLRFDGVIEDDRLAALYAAAAVVAVPSRYEGFGLPALEGLAHGRPVVVADRGALPEVVGTAGRCVDPDDPAAWVAAIDAARADDPGAALDRARELSWERAAAATLAVWRSLG